MIEIFLFVNPIGVACFKNEKTLLDAISHTEKTVQYHYVPISNMETIRADVRRRGWDPNNLEIHNSLAETTYNALQDYHAVSLFGNRKAREFLLRLQNEINGNHLLYNKELVHQILAKMKINTTTFENNRKSKYCKDAIAADFDLATELNVKTTPTTIIFDYEHNDTSGILIEGIVDHDTLIKIFDGEICYPEQEQQKNPTVGLKVL